MSNKSTNKISLGTLLPIMEKYYYNSKDLVRTAEETSINPETIARYYRSFRNDYPSNYSKLEETYSQQLEEYNSTLLEKNVHFNKQKQKAQDINRVERKTFREYARIENSVEEYAKEIVGVLKKHNASLMKATINHNIPKSQEKSVGIIQLSDLHFNEMVDLPNNKYDFNIASKRLKKFATKAKHIFKSNEVNSVVIVFTGDLLNSDRRLDEMLTMSVNRAKASVLATYILKQFILDINKDFNVTITGVVGNESRLKEEMSWSNNVISDSYDYTIIAHLKMMFDNCKGIKFGHFDRMEEVIDVLGKKILIVHGLAFNGKAPEGDVLDTRARYASKKINLDYILFGHIHNTVISDEYARSASLVGSNAYNEHKLNLNSRASQNIYLVDKESINGMRIDLQDSDQYEPYSVIKELMASEQKSVEKTKERKTIFQVII